MYKVSQAYKEAMDARLRNRVYANVSIGIVNQIAQGNGVFTNDVTEWSNINFPWGTRNSDTDYATLEQNYFKMDGSLAFLPEGEYKQYNINVGIATESLLGVVTITFSSAFDIKGLTINFGRVYPTEFTVRTDNKYYTYTNDSPKFETTDLLGETTQIVITPVAMVGGSQRFRIENITMGVGLTFNNTTIQQMDYTEAINAVNNELPSSTFNLTVADENHSFNVDASDSFVNYLETGQPVQASIGVSLADGTIEELPIGRFLLTSWNSKKDQMSFTATDVFRLLDDTYYDGNYIHTRTLYDDAVDVLTYCGFEPDQYLIDECLRDVVIENPMPEVSCSQALQLIANAGRCIVYQNREGLIVFRANFATVIDPDDIQVISNTATVYSHPHNVLEGTDYIYADMTRDFFSLDGSMYFLPESGGNYLATGFVSSGVADDDGEFSVTPSITLQLQAGYVYYGLIMDFGGNPPQEMLIETFLNDEPVGEYEVFDIGARTYIPETFYRFDKMVITFPTGAPNDRVVINRITFGELTDYRLTYHNILGDVTGFKETKTKNVLVKVFSFIEDEEERPQEVEDSVYVSQAVNSQGVNVTFKNPLIGDETLARDVAEWLGVYYSNNVSYSCDYRGDPRLNASDIIYLDSDVLNNLQVEIESQKLSFNGALSGSLNLRRALRLRGEEL